MAGKEATVYAIDLGATMGECHNGRTETDLEYGMKYIWDKIATTMGANRATWTAGIVGFRTDDTNNSLGEGYENISELRPIGPIKLSDLPELRRLIVPSETIEGDAISAIVTAIDMIDQSTKLKSGKPGIYDRKIFLLTDGEGAIDESDLTSISQKIIDSGIELFVIGIDFDDPDYGFKEEDKSALKKQNEALLKNLTETCGGIFGTVAEAIRDMAIPRVKGSRPYATYKGPLALGDFNAYPETAMYIDVERYFRTKSAKAPSASSFVTRTTGAQSSYTIFGDKEMLDVPAGGDLAAVRTSRTYQVNDPTAAGGKRDLEVQELEKGYEYGRTAVSINEGDLSVTKLETKQSFSIIGFIPTEGYEKCFNMGESCITLAQKGNNKALMGLSSLIHALYELESFAIARIVTKDGKEPQIILLAPQIENDFEALIDVPLPFAEDVRVYKFPPLDKFVTSSGVSLGKHRNLPTEDLMSAMDEYVDSMDLSKFGEDDDGNPSEYMPVTETYSPMVHRINQAIRQRAIYPNEPVGAPAEILTKWSIPPAELVEAAEAQLKKLVEVAEVKKVPEKVKGKRGRREMIKPLSGLDVNSLLDRQKRQKISTENAIPGFKQMLADTEDDNVVIDAVNQMSRIIRELISKSFGDKGYAQAKENMAVMREEMIDYEMFDLYNDFVRDLKKRVVKGELGGDRTEFWIQLRGSKLGLIDKKTLEQSDVSEEAAHKFYSLRLDFPT